MFKNFLQKIIIYHLKYISKHMLFVNNNLQEIFMGEIDISINIVFRLTYFIDGIIRLNMDEREMHILMNY